MNLQQIIRRKFNIVKIRLIIVFRIEKERRVDIRKELIGHLFKVISELFSIFGMICDIVLLDKLLKHTEIKIAADILSADRGIGIKVNPVECITARIKRYPRHRVIGDF